MDVTPLVRAGQKIIQSYNSGCFRVSGQVYQGAVIVTPDQAVLWPVSSLENFLMEDFAVIYESSDLPDVVLLGTGASQQFMDKALKQSLRDKGLVIEVMDTGAACRTYNVLVAEGRRVVAALLPV